MNDPNSFFTFADTLGAEMCGLGDFWLETKLIIKFRPILDSQEPLTDYRRNEAKFLFEMFFSK